MLISVPAIKKAAVPVAVRDSGLLGGSVLSGRSRRSRGLYQNDVLVFTLGADNLNLAAGVVRLIL